jgi:hypothetical protein
VELEEEPAVLERLELGFVPLRVLPAAVQPRLGAVEQAVLLEPEERVRAAQRQPGALVRAPAARAAEPDAQEVQRPEPRERSAAAEDAPRA